MLPGDTSLRIEEEIENLQMITTEDRIHVNIEEERECLLLDMSLIRHTWLLLQNSCFPTGTVMAQFAEIWVIVSHFVERIGPVHHTHLLHLMIISVVPDFQNGIVH